MVAIPARASSLNAPAPYDVLVAVNLLRASNALPPLRTNAALMTAAQAQSDYQASIGTWSHTGPNGSSPTQRDIAAGYGATIFTSENVAELGSAVPLDTLINTVWSDSTHMATMLSKNATDMGVGVAEKEGYVYYTLDVSYLAGQPARIGKPYPTPIPAAAAAPVAVPVLAAASAANIPSAPTATPASNNIQPVQTVTPQDLGIVVHVVQAGESLYTIAATYKTTITDIRARNGMADNNDVIYVGQKLWIRVVLTPTASPASISTEPPPTPTPEAALAAGLSTLAVTPSPPPALVPSAGLTFTPAPTFTTFPPQSPPPANQPDQPPLIGIILLVIGGLGLVGALAFYLMRKK